MNICNDVITHHATVQQWHVHFWCKAVFQHQYRYSDYITWFNYCIVTFERQQTANEFQNDEGGMYESDRNVFRVLFRKLYGHKNITSFNRSRQRDGDRNLNHRGCKAKTNFQAILAWCNTHMFYKYSTQHNFMQNANNDHYLVQ